MLPLSPIYLSPMRPLSPLPSTLSNCVLVLAKAVPYAVRVCVCGASA
jgi:hypothetical protein